MIATNQYRLVITSLNKEEEGKPFKRYLYFDRNELGLEEMNQRCLEWEKIVLTDLYNMDFNKDSSYYLTKEYFKRSADGYEISTEIESKKIK